METNVSSIPKTWKKVLKKNQSHSWNLVLLDHQLLKNNRTLGLKKINYKEIYFIIISSKVNIPTSRIYFESKFPFYNFQWKEIYTLPRKVTINAYLRSFQYKILNNILYLNKKTSYLWFIQHTNMFFLQNARRDNKSPILLLHS